MFCCVLKGMTIFWGEGDGGGVEFKMEYLERRVLPKNNACSIYPHEVILEQAMYASN